MIDYRAIKELIATEDKWTTKVLARDVAGKPVGTWEPTACRFCLLGAVSRTQDGSLNALAQLRRDIRAYTGICESPSSFNDTEGFAAVHAFLDHMIAQSSLVEALRKRATQRWSDIGGNRWEMPEWIAADRIEALTRAPSERERKLEAALRNIFKGWERFREHEHEGPFLGALNEARALLTTAVSKDNSIEARVDRGEKS